MIHEPPFLNTVGERDGDFVVTKYVPIPELNCLLREIIHVPTGALIMHIANDDPENLFCLSFKTLPSSSNGAAHVLEHIVLCGSERFPLKDPFFSMNRRSLNTFMNALTGADFTCYPAASQVEKDFYNLLDVYLDAVFHPQLKILSFLQEGHRLEFTVPTDATTPLQHKGVVFNEMKGSLTSADGRLWHQMLEYLFPDLPYAFNSGGDPTEIPQLTCDVLREFHQTYYHPSRCLFFFYGNLPLTQHLRAIAPALNVSATSPIPPLPRQTRFTEPQHRVAYYPIDSAESAEQRTLIALGWLTAPLVEQEDVLALSLLDIILMESDASPLKKALLSSKLCIQADAYIETELSEVPYLIVCKGCSGADADKLEALIMKTLKKMANKPISSSLVDAALHQLELARLEITGDHSPFGLTLFMRSALAKQHGCDPESALQIHSLFTQLLTRLKDPFYLPNMITKYLIENPHRVRLDMYPDAELLSQEAAQERRQLDALQATLTSAQADKIIAQTHDLNAYQQTSESLDCLPKVTLDDVSPLIRDFPLHHVPQTHGDLFYCDIFTNHFIYVDLVFDLPTVTESDLPYVRLLTYLLPELGSGKRDYLNNLEYIQSHTGGLSASCALHVQADDPHLLKPCLHLRGKSLYRKADHLFPLMRDTLLAPHFSDQERITELLVQHRDGLRNRLSKQGMRYASQLALSGYSTYTHIAEAWSGLRYYQAIEALCSDLETKPAAVVDRLLALKDKIFTFHRPTLLLSGETSFIESLSRANFYDLLHLPSPMPFQPWCNHFVIPQVPSQVRPIASPVAFCAEGFQTVPYLHPMAPALLVATLLLDHKILHPRIREQGGAYGCGASYSPNSGHFTIHSYRDPHIAKTWYTFHHAIDEIAAGHFTPSDLEEAKLGVIQQLDSPIAPGSRAITAYSWHRDHKTPAMRQAFRDRLLHLTSQDVAHAITIHLQPLKEEGVFVAFAGQSLIEKENTQMMPSSKTLPIFSIL